MTASKIFFLCARWASILALGLALAACGRTDLSGTTADFPDGYLPPDGGMDGNGDGPPPCKPSCQKICDLQRSCGLISDSKVPACISSCQADPSTAEMLCLGQLVCDPPPADCTAASKCLTDPEVPDLTVSYYTAWSPASGDLNHQANICNKGTGKTGTFYVHFYLNKSSAPTQGMKGDKTVKISSLGIGSCQTVTASHSGLGTGTYNTWVQADADGLILETNEKNNVDGPVPVKVAGGTKKPDLVVSSLSAAPPSGSGQTAYKVTVCNYGQGAAGPTNVDLYYNRTGPPSPNLPGNVALALSGLAVGACKSLPTYASLPPGTYSSWAFVDRKNQVPESVESNNVYGPVKFNVGGSVKPDLVVSSFYTTPTSYGLYYIMKVCNLGKAASSTTQIDIYFNRSSPPPPSLKGNITATVYGMGPGACSTYSRNASLSPGTYFSWAYVDRINYVAESNESNNINGPVKVVVGGGNKPDLVVASLTTIMASSGLYYSVKVCNMGGAPSSGTQLDLYYNQSNPPSPYGKGDLVASVPSLGSGSCYGITLPANLQPGTYLSWAYVDRVNYVAETNENNNVYGPVKVVVGGGGKPDLVVTSLTTLDSLGGTVYSVKVCNMGQAYSTGTYLDLYYNRSTAPPASLKGDMTGSVPALNVGSCTNVTLTTNLPDGTYMSWAYVDRINYVAESNENNNVYGPVKVTVGGGGKPDLLVQSMTATTNTSGYTTYQIIVCNNGTAPASSFALDLYYNRSTAPPANLAGDYPTTVSGLAAGICTTRSRTVVLTPGTYQSWVSLDRTDLVAESNESNNIYGPVKVTVSGTGQPDLQITSMATTQTSGYVVYQIQVCNKGTAQSGTTNLDLYYNRTSAPPVSLPGNMTTYVSYLLPGACTIRNLYALLPGGTYQSWARVDRTNVVVESNETNNVYGPVPVTVGGTGKPDLQIINVSTTNSPTGYFVYAAEICNKGTATSGYTQLEVYFNRSTAPPVGLAGDQYTTVLTLAAGACTTRNIYASLQPGTYTSWLWVDRADAVPESNETNNLYGPMKVQVGTGNKPDLTVTTFYANASAGSYATYYVTACNSGNATSGSTYVEIYYNRSSPPPASLTGNTSVSIPALGPGQCAANNKQVYLPAGNYSSWAWVDRMGYVAESNESNNLKGPYTFSTGGSAYQCSIVCNTLISPCGYISSSQYNTCMSMCMALPMSKVTCAYNQALAKNCYGVVSCIGTPPTP